MYYSEEPSYFELATTKRTAKCRSCAKTNIKKGDEALVLRNCWISPHKHDLWFHVECMESELKRVMEE